MPDTEESSSIPSRTKTSRLNSLRSHRFPSYDRYSDSQIHTVNQDLDLHRQFQASLSLPWDTCVMLCQTYILSQSNAFPGAWLLYSGEKQAKT